MTNDEAIKILEAMIPPRRLRDGKSTTHLMQELALRMAICSLKCVIWHPYPKEKPDVPMFAKVDGVGEVLMTYPYLVTTDRGNIAVDVLAYGCFRNHTVIAWAELPKPYEREVDDEDND